MSQENVDFVRLRFERFIATGEPDWDTLHEDVEVNDHESRIVASIGGTPALAVGFGSGAPLGLNGTWSPRSSSTPATG